MGMVNAPAEVLRVELGPAAALFRSLGDPTRLAIVHRLAAGPARVVELVQAVGLAQSTVSKHLTCLRECGLVDSEPVGRASLHRLTQPALIDLLASAQTVAVCPTYGIDDLPETPWPTPATHTPPSRQSGSPGGAYA